MREAFHGDLARLGDQLSGMCGLAAESMRSATRALLTADLAIAEQVLAGDAGMDALRSECEEHAYALLALQAPVASDLRSVLAVVYCAKKVERMGDLAAHVADTARFNHPDHVVPAEVEDGFAELGRITADMADRVGALVATARGGFAELDHADQHVDALHAGLLATITAPTWRHGVRSATSLALLARFYERFADQAVSVAKRLEFAATGSLPTA
jgi:phosphate transport system protein